MSIREVPVLSSSTVGVVGSARDLGVVIDSRLCKSAPEASRRLRSSGAITCVIPELVWATGRLMSPDRGLNWNKLTVSANSEDS